MPQARLLVYALVDPRTKLVRYVGKSAAGLQRPREHRCPSVLAKTGNQHKANWIRQLHALGLDYEIVVLEVVADTTALAPSEMWWIAYGRACGWPLTNMTDGGEGTIGRPVPAATRELHRRYATGVPKSDETRARLSASLRGGAVAKDEAWRAKIRASNIATKRRWTDDDLHAAIARCDSYLAVCRHLGVSRNSIPALRARVAELGLNFRGRFHAAGETPA